MIRSIVTSLFRVLSLLAFGGGLVQLGLAILTPRNYVLTSASAVQITQVYSEATYTAALAVGLLMTAAVIQLFLHSETAARHQRLLEQQMDELIQAQGE